MDLDLYFETHGFDGSDAYGSDEGFRSGFIALVGRPNAGKSTLLNALAGKKIAITSKVSQTTRHRISAIISRDDFQLIVIDTPGIHKPHDALGEELNDSAMRSLEEVDIVAFMVDATKPIGRGDEWIAARLEEVPARKIAVISKADIASSAQIEGQVKEVERLGGWDSIVLLSAKTSYNLDAFLEECYRLLDRGPAWFPKDMDTDQPLEIMIAEFIREKIAREFRDEIPHSVGVHVGDLEFIERKGLYRIYATIYVERESQKGMIIGHNGKSIKTIGTKARHDLQELLGAKIFLDLNVKVRKNWRQDERSLKMFGFVE